MNGKHDSLLTLGMFAIDGVGSRVIVVILKKGIS